MDFVHVSVMADEVLSALNVKPSGTYADCTLGGGGHAKKIAERLNASGKLIGIDQDADATAAAAKTLADSPCGVEIVRGNFSELDKILDGLNIEKIDGALFDLGVSSHQIDTAARGFSYMHDAPLDMRMDTDKSFSAFNVINEYDETALVKIFSEYGEERFSKRIAKAVASARKISPVKTTGELVQIIERAVPKVSDGGHPAKRVFQAVRIEVNHELEILSSSITAAIRRLKTGGRIAVITFHSLEDRIVKNTFKTLAQDCICPKNFPVCVCGHHAEIKILGKAQTASADEIEKNSRAKPAKLRVAEKL
ncbi:MAG: 16S rRNA (cytosine(1402)-N(4))-methyltransferase RsmH [Selenomonadaceae bacterium]|nr:16S rRNA (cytosine(1402)-N(4))-methyltransferase RsmH [Selenomonadaceae bacterium]